MGKTNFELVGDMYKKFKLPYLGDGSVPHLLDAKTSFFRQICLIEELAELRKAVLEEDLPEIADALVDLVVFALGTAHFYGLPWEDLFAEVMRSNMTKERAQSDGDSKRGNQLDLVKPANYSPPDLIAILKKAGWDGTKS